MLELSLTEQRLTSSRPITDEDFIEIADLYDEWRVEVDGPCTVVLMPPHGNDSSGFNARLIQLVGNWNDTLAEPGRVFESDTRFRWPKRSLRGPDCAWLSAPREAQRKAAGLAFGEFIPEFVFEVRSPSDSWEKRTLERIEEWRDNGALYAFGIDPIGHRVEHRAIKSPEAIAFKSHFEDLVEIAWIIASSPS